MARTELLNNTELFVIDIDGTFRQGTEIVDGGIEFLDFLHKENKKFIFFTNNSSKSPETYIREFAEKGCKICADEILSTADVAVFYLKQYHSNKSVYVVGTEDFKTYLREKGIQLVEDNADVVLVGFDTTFDYNKMKLASNQIRNGADFLVTHTDLNCPVEGGFIPDCGSISASIQASTGVIPKSFGKPSRHTLEMILRKYNVDVAGVTFVGDRLSTDIAIGTENGANTVFVLGGASTREELEAGSIKPDYVVESLQELLNKLKI